MIKNGDLPIPHSTQKIHALEGRHSSQSDYQYSLIFATVQAEEQWPLFQKNRHRQKITAGLENIFSATLAKKSANRRKNRQTQNIFIFFIILNI